MRPRDPVTLKLLPPPCKRYDVRPFHEAALPAIDADPRSPALPIRRKLEMIDRAINTVIDGDKPPAWIQEGDRHRADNHFLKDIWAVAVARCQEVAHV
jgi:hypothetical protein